MCQGVILRRSASQNANAGSVLSSYQMNCLECYAPGVVVGVSVGDGGGVSVAVGVSVGVSVDVGVSVGVAVGVGDGEAVGVREGGMNAVGVTVGVKVTVGVGLGTTVMVSAGIVVAEAGMDVGVDVPSILPGARRIAIHPAQ